MARRSQRKRVASSLDADSSAIAPRPKRTRSSSIPVWEWEGDNGIWTPYAVKDSKRLTKALSDGDSEISLKISRTVTMKIRFSAMTQTNTATGWQRNIQCVPEPVANREEGGAGPAHSGGGGLWEWKDEHGAWQGYPPAISRLLEACRVCAVESVPVESSGRQYSVDLGKLTQTNTESSVSRAVRRIDLPSPTVWQWEDEKGRWHDYDPSLCRQLESEYSKVGGSGRKAVTFEAAGRSYSVDVAKLEQTNTATGVVRKVARKEEEEEEDGAGSRDIVGTSTDVVVATANKKVKTEASLSSASHSKPSTSEAVSTKSKGRQIEEADSHVILTFQGKAPVDYACKQKIGKSQVYEEGGVCWDAMLNQTNLKNNNNKFYIIQLLQDTRSKAFCTWFRWGRVGKTGQNSLTECGTDLERAKLLFTKKFYDKTHNEWDDRDSFTKEPGKYDLLLMDYEAKEEVDGGEGGEGGEDVDGGSGDDVKDKVTSKLDLGLQALIKLICNVQAMEEAVTEMKYDTKKAPLGKLTTNQIKLGYAALKKIEECISNSDYGDQLVQACDQFYTRIPHSFGMQRPPLIRSREMVKEKLALLEALGDIQIAMKLMSDGRGGKNAEELHPIDRHYGSLKCGLSVLEREGEMFKLVEKCVKQTHAKTHSQYSLEVLDVFEVEREGESEKFKDVGNRQLLWHGSRLTNWVGILSQGLRIAPPEAPVTGYMFGKGVYFSDMCSKSTNYCFASRNKPEGIALLCDVALGQTNDLLAADYDAATLPRGKHSTKGLGRVAPNPAHSHTMPDGCMLPLGSGVDTGVHNPTGYTLNYNEYIVYDTSQVKMKYLVKLKFHFK